MTQDELYKTGYFWNSLKVNVSIPFSFEVTMHAGSNNYNGADGLVFVLQDISNSLVGNAGEGMGYSGITPSFGIELDTCKGEPVSTRGLYLLQLIRIQLHWCM